MTRPGITADRMRGLFLLGFLLFNPPLLTIFDLDVFVFGLPVLFVYLFVGWAALIALIALTVESAAKRGLHEVGPEPPSMDTEV